MKSVVCILFAGLLVATAVLSPTADHAANGAKAIKPHRLLIINMDLDFKPHNRSSYGRLQGYDPAVAQVHLGDRIQFVNVDDANHTATGFALTGQVIPADYKFAGDPTVRKGNVVDAHEWSTGNVRAHGKSQVFVTKTTGNFYYACAYHIGKGMKGVIIVKP